MGVFDKDFLEFMELLNKHEVQYLLVGGHAVNAHGRARNTGDLDLLVGTTDENSQKLFKAIDEFGFDSMPIQDYLKSSKKSFEQFIFEKNIKLPSDFDKIEIMGRISGIKSFDDAFSQKKIAIHEGIKLNVISLNDLINNKIASGRPKDLEDAKVLKDNKEAQDKSDHRKPKLGR